VTKQNFFSRKLAAHGISAGNQNAGDHSFNICAGRHAH